MREWVPVSTSAKGRLALVAVRAFGEHPFDEVSVSALAAEADVTTGSLYHHFGSKLGLYQFVRADVEQRLLDRMEGAAASSDVGAALLVGFDFAVRMRFEQLLGTPPPPGAADRLVAVLDRLLAPAAPPLGRVLAAAWRAALLAAADGDPGAAREALNALRIAEPAPTPAPRAGSR